MAGQDRPHPIYSALAEDPAFQDEIDAFVVELAGWVDDLQDCEARADLPGLADLAKELILESAKVGYDALSRSAVAVRDCASVGNALDTRKALVALTEVAQRVRLGHRGSV